MRLSAIQDLYPNPPVLRYHRIPPQIERGFLSSGVMGQIETVRTPINWLDMIVAFLLGFLIGGRNYE